MREDPQWFYRLQEAHRRGSVDRFLQQWTKHLEATPAWSPSSRSDARVPYAMLHPRLEYEIPDGPGLYMWGADRTVDGQGVFVPRYVGFATDSLSQRMVNWKGEFVSRKGRYVPGPKGPCADIPEQCHLATKYWDRIVCAAAGVSNAEYADRLFKELRHLRRKDTILYNLLRAFPSELVARFRAKKSLGMDLRLRHAIDWALHGGQNLEHLWVALLPAADSPSKAQLEKLEEAVILAVRRWNRQQGLPYPLNAKHQIGQDEA